jgi:hypothetical protein
LKFTVYAPFYTDKSGGHWYLHFLCDQLNRIGHETAIYVYDGGPTNPNFIAPQDYLKDSVVIYPETIANNPLNAQKVVRYLLNKDGLLKGKKIEWGNNDFALSYSKDFRSDCDILSYAICDTSIFYDMGLERVYNSFYIGKGQGPQLPGCMEITRQFPAQKEELAKILNRSKIFFTYDCVSSTNLDAILCGAMPYFLTKPPKELYNNEYGKFWIESLDAQEIAAAKENNKHILGQVIENQKTFSKRLAKMVNKIEAHFKDTQ